MSKRSELAQRLAIKVQELGLVNPYGGDVSQDLRSKGKPYRIGFASPRYLDGEIAVYSEKFIQVLFESTSQGRHNLIVESEENAVRLMQAIADFEWSTVHTIPTKGQKKEVNP